MAWMIDKFIEWHVDMMIGRVMRAEVEHFRQAVRIEELLGELDVGVEVEELESNAREDIDEDSLSVLLQDLGALSSVHHRTPDSFVLGFSDVPFEQLEEQESDEERRKKEEEEEEHRNRLVEALLARE